MDSELRALVEQIVEDAAFASHYGCEHNFDFNIDAAIRAGEGS